MRFVIKKAVLKSVYASGGFAPVSWANRSRAIFLTYHRFCEFPHPYRVSAREFEDHLIYLKKHCTVVSLAEAVTSWKLQKTLPKNAVVLTIDDGFIDAYTVAFPLLKAYGFPATVFAITDFVEGKVWLWTDIVRHVFVTTRLSFCNITLSDGNTFKANLDVGEAARLVLANRLNALIKKVPQESKERILGDLAAQLDVSVPSVPLAEYAAIDWDMARVMDANGVAIESHTVTHPVLTMTGSDQLRFELEESKRKLEAELSRPVEVFCYPNGSVDDRVQKAVASAGYKTAVSTKFGFLGQSTDRLLLRRMDAPVEIENFAQTVSGFEYLKRSVARRVSMVKVTGK